MRWPLANVALLYASGIVLGEYIPLPLWLLFASSFGLALGAVWSERRRKLFFCPLLVFFGWTNLTTRTAIVSPFDLRLCFGDAPQVITVRGKLVEAPEQHLFVRDERASWRTLARVDVVEIGRSPDWRKGVGRVAVST